MGPFFLRVMAKRSSRSVKGQKNNGRGKSGTGFGGDVKKEGRNNGLPKQSPSATSFVGGLAVAAASIAAPLSANALPRGMEVRGGDLQLSSPDGSTLVIDQGSSRAVSNWQSFDINSGERVLINQPDSSSLLLGRVVGGSATQILGSLSANGGLLLVNPYGLLIGSRC